ncbi:MAG TPA: TIGR00645 family protein [Xanthobacteraceae bacterium]|nr:TIGR00645 family protein [Xanthobacteraceae bacterium]
MNRNKKEVPGPIEYVIEWLIVRSRWLMAPFYIGLIAGLAVLLVKFGAELVHYVSIALSGSESDIILGVLSLIDLALTGNLVLIVIFSGYENFVSKIEGDGDHDRPNWMEKVDFGGLKQKLITSIVAISAVQVLKAFMNVQQYDSVKLGWLVGIHGLFLVSLIAVAFADFLGARAESGHEPEGRYSTGKKKH